MTLLRKNDPFEILFRNFFDSESLFNTVSQCKFEYPVDIYETDNGLNIEVAAIGIDEKDININIEDGRILRVSYAKTDSNDGTAKYTFHRGIARRSFNLGWKIGTSYNIDEIIASMDKGLLTIKIPHSAKIAPKQITISNKQLKA